MKPSIQIIPALIFLIFVNHAYAQLSPVIQWEKSLGGTDLDQAFSLSKTADGGFVIAGQSFSNDADVSGNHGNADYWIAQVDTAGILLWQKSLGGTKDDIANSIQQTADGGFIIAGRSFSDDLDVTGNHGSKDYWVVKLDAAHNISWEKSFGGSNGEEATSVQETTGGGFIVAGYSNSNDGDVSGGHGSKDYWILKLDASGNIEWSKSLGGSEQDFANSIQQTNDGGFIIAGASGSLDGDVSGNHGFYDYWIVKLDGSGNISWNKSLGGAGDDEASSIQQTADHGYIIAGFSNSHDGDVTDNHGDFDYWIVKTDSVANITWQKSFGGSAVDLAHAIQQTSDGGYIVAGETASNDGNVVMNHGGLDYWILKLDAAATLKGQVSLGGGGYESARAVTAVADSGYVIAGYTASQDGDVSVNHGLDDYWVVRLGNDIPTVINTLIKPDVSIYPNPVQSQLNVILPESSPEAVVAVYDLEGRIINLPQSFLPVADGASHVQINTSSLPSGFYMLVISNNSKSGSQAVKLIRQ